MADIREEEDDEDEFEDDYCEPTYLPVRTLRRHCFWSGDPPRLGTSNPEQMNNPVWEWLIRSRVSAWKAAGYFAAPSPCAAGPTWCFRRFGQTSTLLPDGRVVLISGEHEDHYDPDFYIYNDVVVRHPDGRLEIFCYPGEVFPPTDFHSATLIGEQILIIGNLGYPNQRNPAITPVLALDLETFAITPVGTCGTSPEWLYKHAAMLSEDRSSILISGGYLDRSKEDASPVENIDEWRLHLSDWRWERLTDRQWPRWELIRTDRKSNSLMWCRCAIFSRDISWMDEFKRELAQLTERYGAPPDLDLVTTLYRPPVPHEQLPERKRENSVFRIRVDGVVVRFVESIYSIQMTVEGDLPRATIDTITADLRTKLSAIENASYELVRL